MSNLQRSSSAPQTVAGLTNPQQRIRLPRSKSHLHVEKHEERQYLKPLDTSVPPALSSSSSEREDPFNLAGFFPPEGGSWRWRAEPEKIVEEDEESPEDVIRGEDKLGVLSLFTRSSSSSQTAVVEDRLLSPYRFEAPDWDAVHHDLTGRRRLAEDRLEDAGFGSGGLFFGL